MSEKFKIGGNMYGVVLWSDRDQNRAVIWCEDHGDLAFYRGDETCTLGGADIDPGDLVQFELDEVSDMRVAQKPKLVAQESFPTLSQDLKKAGARLGAVGEIRETRIPRDHNSGVVPFDRTRCVEVA